MSLSLDEVRRIARLAHLRLSPEEAAAFTGQLSAILDHVAQLGELDVSQVEPMTHALAAGDAVPLRPDVPQPGLTLEAALANAPSRQDGCFKVPRIIE